MKHSEVFRGIIFWSVFTLLMIKFPLMRYAAGFIILPQVIMMLWNCFSVNVLHRGTFHKTVSVSTREELPPVFNRILRTDLVRGLVEVSQTRILACGCEEPLGGTKKLTAVESQDHLRKLIEEFEIYDSSLDASNTVYFSFKTEHGRCVVSYRMIGPKSLEQERRNMVTFPASAKYNTSTEDNKLAVTYRGKIAEFSRLSATWDM